MAIEIRYLRDTTEKTKRETEKNSQPDIKFKKWSEQSFGEQVGTVFRLIVTKEGWNKIKSDYADGNLDGYITYGKKYRESIFMRRFQE